MICPHSTPHAEYVCGECLDRIWAERPITTWAVVLTTLTLLFAAFAGLVYALAWTL